MEGTKIETLKAEAKELYEQSKYSEALKLYHEILKTEP